MFEYFKKLADRLDEKKLNYILLGIMGVLFAYTCTRLRLPYRGDEIYYEEEVKHMVECGFYNALTQGTSFIFSLLVFACSKLFFVSILTGGRILNMIAFTGASLALYNIMGYCTGLRKGVKQLVIISLFVFCWSFKWELLPEYVGSFFVLSAIWALLTRRKYSVLLAGVLFFLAFGSKPTAIFTLPGFLLIIFYQYRGTSLMKRMLRAATFGIVFVSLFVVYHIPSYQRYGKLMLEDKSHYYADCQRVERKTNWNEKNVYFELYSNLHNKPNKWAVEFDEVDSFKRAHPDVNLNLSYKQYVTLHTKVWLTNALSKFFTDIPYYVACSTFLGKYGTIGHFIKSNLVIRLMALLFLCFAYYKEWGVIRQVPHLFVFMLLFGATLSFYIIPQLEANWFVYTVPFLTIPLFNYMARYINVILLLGLQFIYFFVLMAM